MQLLLGHLGLKDVVARPQVHVPSDWGTILKVFSGHEVEDSLAA